MAVNPNDKRIFNPNEHLMQIKSGKGASDYLAVQWRLVWFRSICPHGTIDTEELEVDLDRECEAEVPVWNNDTRRMERVLKKAKGYARYRAVVTDGEGGRATGTKSERAVDFPDYAEKAETGAIGRALAALGYGTQFTGDEFDEHYRIVDAPVEREQAAAPATSEKGAAKAEKSAHEGQSPTLVDMIRKAKGRAGKVKAASNADQWSVFVSKVLGSPKPDAQIDLKDIARINGELTRLEQETKAEVNA